MAHRDISLRCGIWSLSGHSGHRSKCADQVRFYEYAPQSRQTDVRQIRANPLFRVIELDTPFASIALKLRAKLQTENHGVGGSIPPLGTT